MALVSNSPRLRQCEPSSDLGHVLWHSPTFLDLTSENLIRKWTDRSRHQVRYKYHWENFNVIYQPL